MSVELAFPPFINPINTIPPRHAQRFISEVNFSSFQVDSVNQCNLYLWHLNCMSLLSVGNYLQGIFPCLCSIFSLSFSYALVPQIRSFFFPEINRKLLIFHYYLFVDHHNKYFLGMKTSQYSYSSCSKGVLTPCFTNIYLPMPHAGFEHPAPSFNHAFLPQSLTLKYKRITLPISFLIVVCKLP